MAVLIKPLLAYSLDPAGINPGTNPTAAGEKIISQVIAVLTVTALIYFVIQIIFAGYSFFTSEGDKNKLETSRKRLTEGVLGVFIVVIALGFGALLARLAGIPDIFDLNQMFTKMGLPPL